MNNAMKSPPCHDPNPDVIPEAEVDAEADAEAEAVRTPDEVDADGVTTAAAPNNAVGAGGKTVTADATGAEERANAGGTDGSPIEEEEEEEEEEEPVTAARTAREPAPRFDDDSGLPGRADLAGIPDRLDAPAISEPGPATEVPVSA